MFQSWLGRTEGNRLQIADETHEHPHSKTVCLEFFSTPRPSITWLKDPQRTRGISMVKEGRLA